MPRSAPMALLATLTALAATALTAGAPVAADHSDTIAMWGMDERRGSSVLVDSSGHGHDGRIGDRVLTEVRLPVGTVHRFAGLPSPAGIHVVPSAARLSPATGGYGVSVRFRTSGVTSNLVQKGQSGTSGGMWKLEIDDGRLKCLFRGSAGNAAVASSERVDDGAWHVVRCQRHGGRVELVIDGAVVARRSDSAGRIANNWEVAIGGKSRCNQVSVGCDPFAGDVDWVRIDRGIPK